MSLTLDESAALIGGHCWTERRLFERLGSWVASMPSTEVKLTLDRHAQHAAWRAAQWWDRLPVLAQVERESLIVAPGRLDAVLAPGDKAEPAGVDAATEVARLAVAYRVVLPRLAAAYQSHLGRAGPVADGPVIRTIGHVAPDLRADWAAGEFVLQELIVSADQVRAAAAAVAGAEQLLLL